MYKKILVSKVTLSLVGAALSVIALTFFFGAQSTQALSCAPYESDADFIAKGGIIFEGTTISNNATAVTGTGTELRNVTFNIHQAWGNTHIPTPFTAQDNVPSAGVPPFGTLQDPWGLRETFTVGKKYIVYTTNDGGLYTVNVGACASSGVSSPSRIASIKSELGEGYIQEDIIVEPRPEEEPYTNGLLAQIQSLLALVASLQQQLAGIENPITVTPVTPSAPSVSCPNVIRGLGIGTKGVDVQSVQKFLRTLGDFSYPINTGFYGPATADSVKTFQCRELGVCFGTPDTTGYGVVGPATRAAMARVCGGPSVTPVNPTVCTAQYAPVCGKIATGQGQSYPPQTIYDERTYGNSCSLKAAGATYLYEGQCRVDNPTSPPNSCKVWNDGCNVCSRSYPGGPLACTERACIWQGVSKCEAYFDDAPTSAAPVVHSFTGPTVLSLSEAGVWKIHASDPQNGSLSYQIDWGEKQYSNSFDSIAALASSGFVQTTTFTHSYKFAGTYTVSITVRDNQGLTAKTTSTVQVGTTEAGTGFSVAPTSGNIPLTVTATITLPPRTGFDLVEVCGPIVVGDINWGDGTTSRPTRLGCSSQRVVTITHTYQTNGTYSASFTRNDGMKYTETIRAGGVFGSNFSANPTSGNAPLVVTFSAPGGSSCLDGNDHTIDFGDGSARESTGSCTSGVQTRTHTYTNAGVYTATLYSIPSGFGPAPIDRTPRAVSSLNIIVGGISSNTCLSDGIAYTEGVKKTCIDRDNNGITECISDATFICRAGSWQIESLPWGPTCTSGSNYGGGYYEQCNTPNDSLSVFEPSGGFYNMGDDIHVRWSTNVSNANAGMYLLLEDSATGRRFKSMKVDRAAGQATINTGSSCNSFFSDGIDGNCTSLRSNIFNGGLRYRIKAVIYTPANACFGFCAPGSTTTTTTLIESFSSPFTLSS